jgi:hypothetical protein
MTLKAERKIITIYEAVRDSVPWDVTCVRTKHTVPFIVSDTRIDRLFHSLVFQHNIPTVAFRLFFASTVLLLRFSPVSMSTRRAVPTMAIVSGRIRVLSYQ